jgi:hypothetical protein
MVQPLEVDIAVDEQPAGSHAKVVVSHTAEGFVFAGVDNQAHGFVQAQEDLYTNLVGRLD